MNPVVNLELINDPKELKAMHYDQMVLKEQAEHNMDQINKRLAQIANMDQLGGVTLPKQAPGSAGKISDATASENETIAEPEDTSATTDN